VLRISGSRISADAADGIPVRLAVKFAAHLFERFNVLPDGRARHVSACAICSPQ
jgi:hypothetical protein